MTIKQKQHLLAYLGYYTGIVDGIWGPASIAATKNFQWKYGMDADGVFGDETRDKIFEVITKPEAPSPAPSDDWWEDIQYFERSEFRCQCGGKYCNGYPVEMDETLIRVADRGRKETGAAWLVSSGLRCERHNASVGGVYNSRHQMGKAMDFRIQGKSAAWTLAYVLKQPEISYAYAIDDSYVHMDRK